MSFIGNFTHLDILLMRRMILPRKKSVDITSAFKPVLRESAKINFNASPPTADTAKPKLQYDIPNPNLLFAYQPGSLKPLALEIDSSRQFDNRII